MILKKIRCMVPPKKRAAFEKARLDWKSLKDCPGFLFQVGGWSQKEPNVAWIYAGWESDAAHEYFMETVHDRIVANHDGTYDSAEVTLEEVPVTLEESWGVGGLCETE